MVMAVVRIYFPVVRIYFPMVRIYFPVVRIFAKVASNRYLLWLEFIFLIVQMYSISWVV
jgi:hypothetical protein